MVRTELIGRSARIIRLTYIIVIPVVWAGCGGWRPGIISVVALKFYLRPPDNEGRLFPFFAVALAPPVTIKTVMKLTTRIFLLLLSLGSPLRLPECLLWYHGENRHP